MTVGISYLWLFWGKPSKLSFQAYMQNSEDTDPTARLFRKACGSWACLYCGKHYSFLASEMGAMHLSNPWEPSFWCSEMPFKKIQLLSSKHALRDHACSSLTVQNWSCRNWNCLKFEGIAVIEVTDHCEGQILLWVFASQVSGFKIISGDNLWRSHIAQQAGFKIMRTKIDCSKIWRSIRWIKQKKQLSLSACPLTRKTTHPNPWKQLVDDQDRRWVKDPCSGEAIVPSWWLEGVQPVKLPILFFWTLTLTTFQKFFLKAVVVNNIGRPLQSFFIKTIHSFLWLSSVSQCSLFSVNYLLIFPFHPYSNHPDANLSKDSHHSLNAISNRLKTPLGDVPLLALPRLDGRL